MADNANANANVHDIAEASVKRAKQNRIRGLTSNVQMFLARAMNGMLAGTGFGGLRDYYKTFGWNPNPEHQNYVAKYLKQDIATRIINSYPDAYWTDEVTVEAEWAQTWDDLVKKHDIYAALRKVDIFAGLGAFAILIVGINDGQQLSTPVQPVRANAARAREITYLQPYLEGSVEVTEFDENPTSPRFGLPVMYRVKPGDVSTTRSNTLVRSRQQREFLVHFSRVLHLADNTMENISFGHSRLESIYNTLDDLLKVVGGSAETYWLTANRGMQVNVDKDLELEPEDAQALSDEIEEYQHNLRRFIRTRGVDVKALGADVSDPRGTFDVLISVLAANTGIPQRVLLGAEAGQLASQQDRANWAVQVDQKESNWAYPKVLKPFMQLLSNTGILPEIDWAKVKITWPEPFKMSPLERGQTSAQQARSATNVARAMETAQKIGVDLISVEECREMIAPSTRLLVLSGTPVGELPPKLSAPVNDPQNKLDQAEAEAEAQAAAFSNGNQPPGQPEAGTNQQNQPPTTSQQ